MTHTEKPVISLILITYNRAHLVERALQSVLRQTFQDFEILLIDNGSQDATPAVLEKYADQERIRLFRFEENVGYKKAMNFALDHLRGEWFAQLGDDDYLSEDAFEQMLNVPRTIDPEINAINCNGVDSSTGKLAGKGLYEDQYLPLDVIVGKTDGIFWGLTKTELLKGELRHKETLLGFEHLFWYQIDLNGARRYYLHKPLRTYCTDHGQTETGRLQSHQGLLTKIRAFEELIKEDFYFELLRKYNPRKFMAECVRGMYYMQLSGNTECFRKYRRLLEVHFPRPTFKAIGRALELSSPALLRFLHRWKGRFHIKGVRSWYSLD